MSRPPTTLPWTVTRSGRSARPERLEPRARRRGPAGRRRLRGQRRTARDAPHHDRAPRCRRGTDTVVPQELSRARGRMDRPPRGRCRARTCARGEDVRTGEVVLRAGAVLRPQDLGLVASLGFAEVRVHRRPRVALSLHRRRGRGARPVREAPARSTTRTASRSAAWWPAPAPKRSTSESCPTCASVLRERLLQAARSADVVLTSGGVSVGDYDLVKSVLAEIGSIDFWQVAMQPGRPLAVGRIADAPFFGLPGNPVASVLCFHLFVRPALWKLGGRTRLDPECVTATAVEPMRKQRRAPRVQARRPPVHRPRLRGLDHGPLRGRASSRRWSPPTASSSSRKLEAT